MREGMTLEELERRHRRLDEWIAEREGKRLSTVDDLDIKRMKKEKLAIKSEIEHRRRIEGFQKLGAAG